MLIDGQEATAVKKLLVDDKGYEQWAVENEKKIATIAHAVRTGPLVSYDPDTWRPYCHVKDFSRIVFKVLISDNNIVRNQVFNVGSNQNNYRKIDLVNLLKKYKKNSKINILKKKVDPRDYRVNFNKLTRILKIKPKFSVKYGIKEIFKKIKNNKISKDHGNHIIKSDVKK